MDDQEVAKYWDENAPEWVHAVRAGYDLSREQVNNPAFLAVSVSYMPGWKALDEDGQERMVYQAQLSILGSYINAGDTKLTFVYSPDSYALGKNISLTAALLSALSFVILKRRQLPQEE